MVDTHSHIYLEDFSEEKYDAVNRAIAAGVTRLVLPNVDLASLPLMRELYEVYPFSMAMAIGIHPSELGDDADGLLDRIEPLVGTGEFHAIGEIGLDLHWEENPPLDVQQRAFERQLGWGVRHNLPVIIHCRDARDRVLESIRKIQSGLKPEEKLPPLIFHSFTGSPEDVRIIRETCDPYFGINGVVTFKNARALREALHDIGPEKMLLETDCPWLAPVPHRGERNESSYIPLILNCCAAELAIPPQELERITDANASALFFPNP